MRLSKIPLAASLYFSLVYCGFCHAEDDRDLLNEFLGKISQQITALDLWYSHYSVHPTAYDLGSLNNQNQDLYFSDSTLQVSNRYTSAKGSAITARSCTIENMSAPIFFKNNFAGIDGGAIYTTTACTIADNAQFIYFDRNIGQTNGGAIYAQNQLTFKNNSNPIYFIGNFHSAIRALNLLIQNCKDILFFNNEGGALLFDADSSVCNISADNGDIIFYMNQKRNSDQKYFRNSIAFDTTGNLSLGAKKHHSIRLYDPILFKKATLTDQITIFNESDDHQGSIIFSAQYIPQQRSTLEDRLSYVGSCTLKNGVVSLVDGAGLSATTLSQDRGVLCLGKEALVTTKHYEGSAAISGTQLSISKLALDITALIKSEARPPRIWIYPQSTTTANVTSYQDDVNPTITLSGDLLFLGKEGEDPYDLIDLSKPLEQVALLCLWDNATPKITFDTLNLDGVNTQQHYGYQGKWSLAWMDQPAFIQDTSSAIGVNPTRRILYGSWTPTGVYIPDPKYNSPLIANAIWESVYALIPGMRFNCCPGDSTISGQLLGMVHVQNDNNNLPGYHMRAKAYWVEAAHVGLCNRKLSFHIGQAFSHVKEKHTKHKLASKNYSATLKMTSPMCREIINIATCLGYSFGSHISKCTYVDGKNAIGDFESHAIGASARFFKPFILGSYVEVSPFVETRCFHAFLSSFVENTAVKTDVRRFNFNHPFWDFTTPIGVHVLPQKEDSCYPHPSWSCSVAYQPTWYRKKPALKITKVVSKGSWISSGTDVSKHAISLNITSELRPLPFLRTTCSYEGTFSTTTVCNYMTLKGALSF